MLFFFLGGHFKFSQGRWYFSFPWVFSSFFSSKIFPRGWAESDLAVSWLKEKIVAGGNQCSPNLSAHLKKNNRHLHHTAHGAHPIVTASGWCRGKFGILFCGEWDPWQLSGLGIVRFTETLLQGQEGRVWKRDLERLSSFQILRESWKPSLLAKIKPCNAAEMYGPCFVLRGTVGKLLPHDLTP